MSGDLCDSWVNMTRLWPEGEPIRVEADATGRPLHFTWQGRNHRVQQIRQRWQIDTDWWSDDGRVWRDCLALTTATGLLCVIYQDLLTEQWYLTRLYD